jgi:hypothetical protein
VDLVVEVPSVENQEVDLVVTAVVAEEALPSVEDAL